MRLRFVKTCRWLTDVMLPKRWHWIAIAGALGLMIAALVHIGKNEAEHSRSADRRIAANFTILQQELLHQQRVDQMLADSIRRLKRLERRSQRGREVARILRILSGQDLTPRQRRLLRRILMSTGSVPSPGTPSPRGGSGDHDGGRGGQANPPGSSTPGVSPPAQPGPGSNTPPVQPQPEAPPISPVIDPPPVDIDGPSGPLPPIDLPPLPPPLPRQVATPNARFNLISGPSARVVVEFPGGHWRRGRSSGSVGIAASTLARRSAAT